MQEAWCRFEKTISAKLLEEVWEPVLCRTVLNLVLDLGRKRDNQTSMKVDIDELPRELNDGPKRRSGAPLVTPSHEAAVVNRVFAEQATARLGLSPPEREALRLQIMDLQTQEEIAERLGVSARQVRRYILDGMTKVRAFLK
jgi:RNA polymerase sigma factor (sigma-70 family)